MERASIANHFIGPSHVPNITRWRRLPPWVQNTANRQRVQRPMLTGSRPINPPFSRTATATPVQHFVPHRDRSIPEDQVAIHTIKCYHAARPAAPKTG